jgi:phosphotransferase system enzyme I (PtsP)
MLTTLRSIVLEFSREAELERALIRMVSQVKNVMNTDCCSVYLADHNKQHFLLMASDGLAKDSLGQTTIGFSEGLVGLVGQREELLNIANAHKHPHFIHAPEVQEDELNAFLAAPIIHQRKVLGIISIQQKDTRYFSEDEEAFLVTLSAQLATSIAHAQSMGLLGYSNDHSSYHHLMGISAAPGVALGEIYISQPKANLSSIILQKSLSVHRERRRFKSAVLKTLTDFNEMKSKLSSVISDNSLDIFDVYKQLLESVDLGKEVMNEIDDAWSAESALKLVIDNYVLQFEVLEDSYLKERASDIRDLGNRLLFNLQLQKLQKQPLPDEFILIAEDVTATMLAEYQHKGLKAIVSLTGSNNSHAAILARALGIPAVMGLNKVQLSQFEQQEAIVDGYTGELMLSPSESLKREYQHLITEESLLAAKIKEVEHLPATTLDDETIELLLNAGLTSDFEYGKPEGISGVGLYRTEIPFMNRRCFPSEKEQTTLYRKILSAFPNQPVTMRTLDVGGDKSLPYFPIVEDNPFLGWRGIRITLDHPEIFLLQIRAMIRANHGHNNLAIMLPMISNVSEVEEATRLINQAYYELCAEFTVESNGELNTGTTASLVDKLPKNNEQTLLRPKIGIMLEVPSVIFQLAELAKMVDFFSVGSNDLTQYLLAVDRNNSRIASLYDSYHPGVIRALNMIAQESSKLKIPLSLCGELASEPEGALLLIAMGYDKLSLNHHNVTRIKWVIRHIEMKQAKYILMHVLTLDTAKKVRRYLNEQLEDLGLGGFVRAGM